MKSPRFKIWSLCLAVAASAVVIRLAMIAGPILTFSTSVIFLGPISGIVIDRRMGGTGIAGGVIVGIISGLALSSHMNIYKHYLGSPFSWYVLTVSTTCYVMLEAFCGWLWGRTWNSFMASFANARPKGTEI